MKLTRISLNLAVATVYCTLCSYSSSTLAADNTECSTLFHEQQWSQALQVCQKEADTESITQGEAQYYLATMLSFQLDSSYKIDIQKGYEYLEKSALNNYTPAYFILSSTYHDGINIEENPEKSFYWMNKSAISGETDGAILVSFYYNMGYGTRQDFELSKFWAMVARFEIENSINENEY